MAQINDINMESETETDKINVRDSKKIFTEVEDIISKKNILDKTLKGLLKELERAIRLEQKEFSKKKKNVSVGEKRDPSGFNAKQPVPIEFCKEPWGCEEGQEVARTKLTKMVYDYVRENNLQNPKDRRIIFPDDHIKNLFHLKDGDELHFNNFQTYMKRLYNRNFNNESDSQDSEAVEDEEQEEEIIVAPVVSKTEKSKRKKNDKAKN